MADLAVARGTAGAQVAPAASGDAAARGGAVARDSRSLTAPRRFTPRPSIVRAAPRGDSAAASRRAGTGVVPRVWRHHLCPIAGRWASSLAANSNASREQLLPEFGGRAAEFRAYHPSCGMVDEFDAPRRITLHTTHPPLGGDRAWPLADPDRCHPAGTRPASDQCFPGCVISA